MAPRQTPAQQRRSIQGRLRRAVLRLLGWSPDHNKPGPGAWLRPVDLPFCSLYGENWSVSGVEGATPGWGARSGPCSRGVQATGAGLH